MSFDFVLAVVRFWYPLRIARMTAAVSAQATFVGSPDPDPAPPAAPRSLPARRDAAEAKAPSVVPPPRLPAPPPAPPPAPLFDALASRSRLVSL